MPFCEAFFKSGSKTLFNSLTLLLLCTLVVFLKMFEKIYILNLHRYKKKIRMLNLPSKAPLTWEAWEDFKIPECYQKLHSDAQYLRYSMHVLMVIFVN